MYEAAGQWWPGMPSWAAPGGARDWGAIDRQRERIARHHRELRDKHGRALREVEAVRAARSARPVTSRMPDPEIRELAELRAEVMAGRVDAIAQPMTDGALLAWLCAEVEALGARPDAFAFEGDRPHADQLRGFIARARCARWWRRQLRRAVVRLRETEACRAGEVCATRRQPYVTHDTAARHRLRAAANAAALAATELENEAGQVMTLADLAAKSPANKGIRRGELMTRISGCEALAVSAGHRGVFLTLTAPSRFHPVLRHGERNPRHDGSTPREAHEWLCGTWAKARARLARIGVTFYGFRVAEPHHDGCPHWHALLWCEPGRLWRLVLNLKRWWLRDGGGEPGARAHRLKAVLMRPGGAAGYVAKYIAKNIDDAGAVGQDGHTDDDYDGPGQLDAFGGNHQRVEAWASCWGIRQFQAIGQPPVTVWRELRRVDAQGQGGATGRLSLAFAAVNRDGARRADWAAYVLAQGGLMKGRDYLLRVAREVVEKAGRYETTQQAMPWGVFDVEAPAVIHPSNRVEWRPRGAWGQRAAPQAARAPWTRVINCTQATRTAGVLRPNRAPLVAWSDAIKGADCGAGTESGGSDHQQGVEAWKKTERWAALRVLRA